MYKNFILTESEKEEILELHKKHGYKKSLTEQVSSNNIDNKLKCIQQTLEKVISDYNNENYDDKWYELKQEQRRIRGYFEDGYFLSDKDDVKNQMTIFLKDLNYSDSYTYKMGEKVGELPTTGSWDKDSKIPIYRAIGDKILFRGVSLKDWERIKKQGFIDSDMRGAILETEGINLGQTPSTARNYLPNSSEGVILAISPKDLDLYMLQDEYIRVFEPIPLKNVIKISEVFITNKVGGILSKDTEKKTNEMISRLNNLDININC